MLRLREPRTALADFAAPDGRGMFVYFDNDSRGHAPHDTEALARLVDDT